MATMSEFKLEPIKTALAMGNFAEARRLRTELWRDVLERIKGYVPSDLDRMASFDSCIGGDWRNELAQSALLADSLDIPEET